MAPFTIHKWKRAGVMDSFLAAAVRRARDADLVDLSDMSMMAVLSARHQGATVQIYGLQNGNKLNGTNGSIIDWHMPSGRWMIKCSGTGECLRLRFENVRLPHAVGPARSAFRISEVPGKGLGCVAMRDIAAGERLLEEWPLLAVTPVSPSVEAAFAKLSSAERSQVMALAQDEHRFGTTKSVAGIFATNAIPSHAYAKGHLAIFPTAARFNHSCDPDAVFRYNHATGRLTVHACRPVAAGAELCVHYGFPAGCVQLEARRQRLLEAFGFECTCSACSMKGTALEANELRLGAIGDKTSWFGDLVGLVREWDTLISSEVGEVLSPLERRRALMNDSTPGGFFHSAELFLQSGVEGCEAAALRLIELVRECPTATHANGMQVTQLSLQDEDSGESKVVPLSTALLEDKVRRYVDAARSWARKAMEATKQLRGPDSPAYKVKGRPRSAQIASECH